MDGVYALAGVAIGGLSTWLLARSQWGNALKEKRRDEVLALVSEFLRDVDTVWSAKQSLVYSVLEIQADQGNKEGWERRSAAFEEGRMPARNAGLSLPRMHFLIPDIAPSAAKLLTCAHTFTLEESEQNKADYAAAVGEFYRAAQPHIS